jgi:hypothetical protein
MGVRAHPDVGFIPLIPHVSHHAEGGLTRITRTFLKEKRRLKTRKTFKAHPLLRPALNSGRRSR